MWIGCNRDLPILQGLEHSGQTDGLLWRLVEAIPSHQYGEKLAGSFQLKDELVAAIEAERKVCPLLENSLGDGISAGKNTFRTV